MELLASGIAEFVSCDGQLYVGCARCGREARVHYRWVAEPAHSLKGVCKTCGSELKDFVRHLFDDVHRCRDCDNRFEWKSAGFDATSCSRCGSSNVELLERQLYPPFPSTFDQIAPPKKHPWGTLLDDDLSHMRSELGLARSQLDFANY